MRPQHRAGKPVKFFERPFNFFDGEGESPDGPLSDRMTLLADSTGREIWHDDRRRLTTKECLEFLLDAPKKYANVWYGFGYDITNVLYDLPRGKLMYLLEHNRVTWEGYKLEYIPTKTFRVTHRPCSCRRLGLANNRGQCKHYRSYLAHDVIGFFQTSFLATMEQPLWYKTKDPAILEIIERGKKARGQFADWDMADVIAYNRAELIVGTEIMENFRDALRPTQYSKLKQWNGAGALASVWLQNIHGLDDTREPEAADQFYAPIPSEMEDARNRTFFGGRIDTAVIGEGRMAEGDIQSAYPAGMTTLVDQTKLTWKLRKRYPKRDDIGIMHVKWKVPADTWWGPFPYREADNTIKFPLEGEGWYHAVEVRAARKRFPKHIKVLEAWEAIGERVYPFAGPVERDYKLRSEYKHMTPPHPANVPLKLGLNSLYGKMAQRVGVKLLPDGTIKTPRFHNLFNAGQITAYCRARVSEAILAHGDKNVFMVATDGVFVRDDWSLIEPDTLGSFEIDSKTYRAVLAGPGMYATFCKDGSAHKNKRRGFGGAAIDYRDVLRKWRRGESVLHPVRRMVTMGQASLSDEAYAKRGCFIDGEREMKEIVSEQHPYMAKRYRNLYSPEYIGRLELLRPGLRNSDVCSAPYEILRKRDLRRDENG